MSRRNPDLIDALRAAIEAERAIERAQRTARDGVDENGDYPPTRGGGCGMCQSRDGWHSFPCSCPCHFDTLHFDK